MLRTLAKASGVQSSQLKRREFPTLLDGAVCWFPAVSGAIILNCKWA
jgi:hypothetical protein